MYTLFEASAQRIGRYRDVALGSLLVPLAGFDRVGLAAPAQIVEHRDCVFGQRVVFLFRCSQKFIKRLIVFTFSQQCLRVPQLTVDVCAG